MHMMTNDQARSHTFGALLLTMLLLLGCGETDFRPEAIGPEGQVNVVIDSVLWAGPVGDALRDQLGGPIFTLPTREATFDLKQTAITSQHTLDQVKKFKNVVFVAPLSDTTNEARYINSILTEEAKAAIIEGGAATVPRSNLWRRWQQVFYVTASTPENLVTAIEENGPGIVYQFNEITRKRLQRDMFDRGRQPKIEAYLMDNHNFAVHAQHDYVVAMDTSNFIWLRRILSDTWRSFFVYYEDNADPSKLSPEWIYNARDALTQRYVRGNLDGWVEIDRRLPLESEEINFKDRYAYETRGLWHMVGEENGEKIQMGMGGAFVTYAFYDQPSARLYLIDGMVFAPNFPKREFLRQLEVIAYTFRTRQDVEQAEQVAARH